MCPVLPAAFLFVLVGAEAPASGQFFTDRSKDVQLGEEFTQRWKVGMVIRARSGPCAGIYGTAAVPTDWPEQLVRIVEEEISPQVQVRYRMSGGGVRQMLVTVRRLGMGETGSALITYEVVKRQLMAPDDPDAFLTPTNPPLEVRKHLATSPLIECRHPSIRSKVNEIVSKEDNAWRQVETIYDWVRDNFEGRKGPVKGAVATLRDGYGGHEDLTSLFIALCRAHKIPARTVWLPDHCYAEFYLSENQDKGRWIPCQVAGDREFGLTTDRRPILQKGDNVKVAEVREPQRYVAEFVRGKTGRGMGAPSVSFVRQLLPDK